MSTLEITENKAATAQQTPTQISGSKAVLEALLSEGVDTVFGYPGGAIMPIYDALYDYTDRLKHILVRHEQGGIHAAQGYARTSGRTGVVFATSGPGATNLVTGLADAMIDSNPLLHSWEQMLFRKQMSSISRHRSPNGTTKSPTQLKFQLHSQKHFISQALVVQGRY